LIPLILHIYVHMSRNIAITTVHYSELNEKQSCPNQKREAVIAFFGDWQV